MHALATALDKNKKKKSKKDCTGTERHSKVTKQGRLELASWGDFKCFIIDKFDGRYLCDHQ